MTQPKPPVNLTNQTFGLLTVTKPSPKRDKWSHKLWLCQCQCGKFVHLATGTLLRGQRSCGCQRVQRAKISAGMKKVWAQRKQQEPKL